MIDLEGRDIPSVFVATVEFIDAAEKQSRALGRETRAVFVPHPIQNRSDEEMVQIADDAFERILAALEAK